MQDALSKIFDTAPQRNLEAGQTLFVNGDGVQSVFRVRRGCIHLERHTPSGQPLILTAALAGDILAEASVYSKNYHCDAVAAEPSTIAFVPRGVFRETIHANRELSQQWAALLASGLQAARTKAEIRTLGKVADRLDAWIAAGNRLPQNGKIQNVAAEIGVSREALYRELSKRRGR